MKKLIIWLVSVTTVACILFFSYLFNSSVKKEEGRVDVQYPAKRDHNMTEQDQIGESYVISSNKNSHQEDELRLGSENNKNLAEKNPRAPVIQVEIHKSSPEKEAEYEAEFREYVKEREAGYPEIVPESGMITVSNAVEIAAAVYLGYDKTQTPKVELGKGVYTVTLWNHRRPMLSTSYFAAIIDIDAWSGEVVNVLLSAD